MSSISFEKSSVPERDLGAVESEGTLPTHRPRRRRVPLTLLLAWAVIAIAVLWALAPQLFTAYSGTEGIAGAQRLAPGANIGWAPINWGATSMRALFMALRRRCPPRWWRSL